MLKTGEIKDLKTIFSTEFTAYSEVERFLIWYYFSAASKSHPFVVKTTLKTWKVFRHKHEWIKWWTIIQLTNSVLFVSLPTKWIFGRETNSAYSRIDTHINCRYHTYRLSSRGIVDSPFKIICKEIDKRLPYMYQFAIYVIWYNIVFIPVNVVDWYKAIIKLRHICVWL